MRRKNVTGPLLLIFVVLMVFTTSRIVPVNALTWTTAQKLGMDSVSDDPKLRFVDAAPTASTPLKTDSAVKYVDSNSNNHWDAGETAVYDVNLNSKYDAGETVIAGTSPSVGTSLRTDSKVRLVDTNNNNVWDLGEAVVYDSNSSNSYDVGELVIAGFAPPLQSTLVYNSRIKYFDTNGLNTWDPGEPVVYETGVANGIYDSSIDTKVKFVDSNSNLSWDSPEPVAYDTNNNGFYDSGEPIISWTPPSVGASLRSSTLIKIVDANRSGAWDPGEAVVIDNNPSNSIYDTAEPLMSGAYPVLGSGLITGATQKFKFVDTNSNTIADAGESVIYDSDNDNVYDPWTDPLIKFIDSLSPNGHWDSGEAIIYDSNGDNLYNCTDTVITGGTPPCFEEPALSIDSLFRFVDSNRNSVWSTGESVIRDANNDFIYNAGDTLAFGTAPPIGTPLREPLIAGALPAVGTSVILDSKLKFVSTNGDAVWDPGEPVVRDTNNDGIFQSGEPVIAGIPPAVGTILSEPVIAGPTPAIGAILRSDSKVKFVDGNTNGAWDPGEIVSYDSNISGFFDQGETVIAYAAKATDGLWNIGEVVVYDANNSNTFGTGDTAISGSLPSAGTPLRTDANIRFFDANSNAIRDSGETVVYDTNNNHEYDFLPTAEPVIAGPNPDVKLVEWPSIAADPSGRMWLTWNENTIGSTEKPDVYFRMWDGNSWSVKRQVTTDAGTDNTNFVLALSDQTMMILWSSDRTGNPELFYKTYSSQGSNPQPLTGETQLTTNSLYDKAPSAVQDGYGRIWVTWIRRDASGGRSDIYYKYFMNGNWYGDFVLPVASSPTFQEVSPAIAETKNGKVMITWASNDTGNLELYTTTADATPESLPSTGLPSTSWSPKTLRFTTNNEDDHPTMTLARDGTLWLFFQRTPSSGSGGPQVYASSSIDNGSSFSSPSLFADVVDSSPGVGQMKDGRVWVFWNRQGTLTDEIWYSKSDPITSIHDVGINSIITGPKFLKSGNPAAPSPPVNVLKINVTVSNYGDSSENTVLTIKLNNTVLTTMSLTLVAGEVRLIQYSYPTTLGFWGRYIPTASLQTVSGETPILQGDNSISGSLVRISPPGDVDGNGVINILDAATVAYSYGTHPGDPLWNPLADVNYDNQISILDAAIVAFYYLKSV